MHLFFAQAAASSSTVTDALIASGPMAVVLGFGLYMVGRWGLRKDKEVKDLNKLIFEVRNDHQADVERLKNERDDVRTEMQDKLDASHVQVQDLLKEFMLKLEAGDD